MLQFLESKPDNVFDYFTIISSKVQIKPRVHNGRLALRLRKTCLALDRLTKIKSYVDDTISFRVLNLHITGVRQINLLSADSNYR